MTRMSTRVGQAYVAITADASNMNNEIVDGLKKVNTKDMAKRHGKEYAKEFERHVSGLEDALKDAVKGMSRAITTDQNMKKRIGEMLDASIDGPTNQRTRATWKRLFEHVGNEAGVGFGTEFDEVVKKSVRKTFQKSLRDAAKSGKFSLSDIISHIGRGEDASKLIDLGPALDRAVADVRKTVQKINTEWEAGVKKNASFSDRFFVARTRLIERSNEAIEKSEADLVKSQQRLMDRLTAEYEAGQRANLTFTERFLKARTRLVEESTRAVAQSEAALVREQEKLMARLTAQFEREEAEKWRIRNASLKAYEKYLRDVERGRINERGEDIAGGRRDESNFVDRMARMFGKGSRMDGIHYFGSVVGGAMKAVMGSINLLGKSLTGLGSLAKSVGQTFKEGFQSAAEGAGTLTKTMAGVSAVGGRAIASIAATGPGAILAILGALAAATVAAGVLTAALSILASVVSALAALATALVGSLVAGLTAGVMVLSGALVAGAAAVGALALAFASLNDKQKALLKGSMEPFIGTMKRIGQTMAREMSPAFEAWGKNLNRFGRMMEPWAASMGKAFGDAGKILTESFTGPGFQKLSYSLGIYLPGIIRKLSQATGDFLNGMAGMFSAIMPFVNRFATYLTEVAGRFSEWANSAKGQNSISDFMERAWQSLKSFWGALREFGGFLKDVLFNPATMKMGDGMFDSLRDSFAGFREAIGDGSLERWLQQGAEFGSAMKDVISALADTFRSLSDSGTLSNVSSTLRTFADIMRALDPHIRLVVMGVNFLYDALSNMLSILKPSISFIGWAGEKLGFLTDESDRAAPSLEGVGSSIQTAADKARDAAAHVTALAGAFDLAGGSASAANRQMALRELEKIPGLFEQMERFRIGKGDMISAVLGDPAAIKRINEALSNVNPLWSENREGVELLRNAMSGTSGTFAQVTREAQENAAAMGTLRDIYPQIPKRVVSKFEQQGIPETRRELREMISEIKMTPEQRKLVMSIFGDKDVLRAARKTGEDIENLPDAKIGIDADVKGAEKKASSVTKMIEKTKAVFGIGANTKPANADVKKAVSRAERFNAIFKVGANTKPANADVRKAVSRAEQFNAIFKVEANTTKAKRDGEMASGLIERLKTVLKVDAKTTEAENKANSAVRRVNQMTASIKVNADMTAFNNAVANARNVRVPVRTGGGGGGGGGGSTAPGSTPFAPSTPLSERLNETATRGLGRMMDSADRSTKAARALPRPTPTAKPKAPKASDSDMGKKGKKTPARGELSDSVMAYYREVARSILAAMPTFLDELKKAVIEANKAVNDTLVAAASAGNAGEVVSLLNSQIDSMLSATQSQVDSARSAVASAAESLASATTNAEAKAAEKALQKAQRDLDAALEAQAAQGEVARILEQQRVVNQSVVDAIADQITTSGPSGAAKAIQDLINSDKTTLADFAAVRELLAGQIQQANDALAKAIADRDAFEQAVSGSVRSFAALTTAQARVVDGVTQALTATDITDNLRDRLEKVKKYQSDLNALLAMGISDDLYRQLLEAGVEVGSEYANALLEGGVGSIDEANQLVEDINAVADGLGTEAANRLHQAGIDMAQGVLDGLIQLEDQIDEAAANLGNKIAAAVATALEDVIGNHTVPTPRPNGPRGAAANALAGLAPSPAAAASRGPLTPVSGNAPRPAFRDLVVQTPTKDPKAVAYEVLNEVAGRL